MDRPDISTTFGALLIGVLLSAFFFGFVTLQSYLYYRTFTKDPLSLKVAVATLWVLNTAHLSFISHAQYRYLVTNFLQPPANDIQTWSLSLHLPVTAVVTFIVQIFLVGRIWLLSGKNVLLIGGIIPLLVGRLAIAIITTVVTFRIGRFSESIHERAWITASLASVLPTDVAITATMAYFLRYNRISPKEKDTTLDLLMLYTLHTGFLPCLLAVISLICFATMHNNLIFVAIHFLLGELYTSCMLVILNARESLHGRGDYTSSFTLTANSMSNKAFGKASTRNATRFTDSTRYSHQGLTHLNTDSISSLEFRGIRERDTLTPVYLVHPGEETDSIASGSRVGSTTLGFGHGTLAPLDEEPVSAQSIRSTESTSTKSRLTDANLSWDSVSSRSMERPARDLGDIDWDGGAIRWQLGQPRN